jgi:DNA-directed RNA polymerase subunit B
VKVGDKLASRFGQKGVVSRLVGFEDMPYMAGGTRPTILVNPHAFPSRMTLGQMLESALVRHNSIRDGEVRVIRSFQRIDGEIGEIGEIGESSEIGEVSDIGEEGVAIGADIDCLEEMFDPRTGSRLGATSVSASSVSASSVGSGQFCGINYYHRLKHMVGAKVRVRGSEGRTDPLTGQAVQGRKQNGGLRVGEMEMLVLECRRWDYGGLRFHRGTRSATIPTRPFCGTDHRRHHRRYRQVSRAMLRMWEELAAVGIQMDFFER